MSDVLHPRAIGPLPSTQHGNTPSRKPRRARFTVSQFWRMFTHNVFDGRRVELIEGEIIEMPSQEEPHAVTVNKVRIALERAFGDRYYVRAQATLRLGKWNAPDPDVAVVEGNMEEWASRQVPTSALLVVEVSDTTISGDRNRKARIYAQAAIADYWIVDIHARRVEVRRDPQPDPSSKTGFSYGSVQTFDETDSVAALAMPAAPINVSALLPRRTTESA